MSCHQFLQFPVIPGISLIQSCSVSSAGAEPFMNGTSAIYIEEMYESWKADPNSVHKSWHTFFSNVDQG